MSVIGPFDPETWFTMKALHGSIKFWKEADANRYREAIDKSRKLLDEMKVA